LAWIRPDALDAVYTVLSKTDVTGGLTGDDVLLYFFGVDNGYISTKYFSPSGGSQTATDDTTQLTVAWHRTIATYSLAGSTVTVKLYKDNALVKTVTSSGPLIDKKDATAWIGVREQESGSALNKMEYFIGYIYEIEVFNDDLT
jgi:hypothetical protein